MPTPLVNLRLDTNMVAAVDRLAAKRGTNRSEIIREAVARVLELEQTETEKVA
jgi:predicted transcriptional regulator